MCVCLGQIHEQHTGVVYTMEHEVVPRPCKICDWLLNLYRDHFGLHRRKKCHSDYGVQGPQKTYFKAYIIHWHSPRGFAMGEAKEMLYCIKVGAHVREMLL